MIRLIVEDEDGLEWADFDEENNTNCLMCYLPTHNDILKEGMCEDCYSGCDWLFKLFFDLELELEIIVKNR